MAAYLEQNIEVVKVKNLYLEQNIEVVKVKNLSTDIGEVFQQKFPMLDEVSPKETFVYCAQGMG